MISILAQLASNSAARVDNKSRPSRTNKAVRLQKAQAKAVLEFLIACPNSKWTPIQIADWATNEFQMPINTHMVGQWLKQWVGIYLQRKRIKLYRRNTLQSFYSAKPGITLANLKDL